MEGIDYSMSRPDLRQVAAVGYGFICRYLSYDRSKNIDRAELDLAMSLNLSVVLVWETTAGRALAGYRAGQDDATEATNQARMLGVTGRPIYFAVDFDASPGEQPAIDDYLRGSANVIGLARVGVYGSFWTVKRSLDNGTARYAWQTYAWSGGNVDSRAHIYQRQNGIRAYGGEFDLNESRQEDFGQYPFDDERRDEDMIAVVGFDDGTKRLWLVDFGAKTKWWIPGPIYLKWLQDVSSNYFGKGIPVIHGKQMRAFGELFRDIDAPGGSTTEVLSLLKKAAEAHASGGATPAEVADELARRLEE